MVHRRSIYLEAVAGVVLVLAAVVELTTDGFLALLGFAALGALLGAWVAVYDHVLCNGEPVRRTVLLPWVVRGIVLVPGLAALHLLFGMTLWVIVILALLVWAVRTSLHAP